MDYDAILTQVATLLQQEQRLAYRVLKRRFQRDDDLQGSACGGSATTNEGPCHDNTP